MTARTLILSVDRDDDVGYKAGVETPVVGREACLEAAVKLGVADPEDSDTNAIFQAVKTYDDQKAKGGDVEVAVISGNHLNMLEGDRRIATLLEKVVADTGVSECVLISDGAEDEYVLPIIQSYLKVVGIVRVTIKQLPNIEGTYYILKKLMNDPKVARTFLVPLGAVMLIGALVALLAPGVSALLVVIGIVGLYLLFKGFDLDEYFSVLYHGLIDSFKRGRFSGIAYVSSGILIIVGVISGLMSVVDYYPNIGEAGIIYHALTFLYGSIAWFVIAGLVVTAGKITDFVQNYQEGLSRIFVIPFFIVAIGMISYGAVIYFLTISPLEPFPFTTTDGIIAIIALTIAGLVLAFIGMYTRPMVHRKIIHWMEQRKELEMEAEEHARTGQPLYRKIKY